MYINYYLKFHLQILRVAVFVQFAIMQFVFLWIVASLKFSFLLPECLLSPYRINYV